MCQHALVSCVPGLERAKESKLINKERAAADKSVNKAKEVALDYLRSLQRTNGLWPYLPGREGAMEAAVWAAIACRQNDSCLQNFFRGLLSLQNADGGWSNEPARLDSDWTTAAALFGLELIKSTHAGVVKTLNSDIESACRKAQQWIMENRCEHYSSAAKFALLVWKGPSYDYERGWSWTQNTFDWVEPTAYALLSLRQANIAGQPGVAKAIEFGEEFLLKLVCKEGGWNLGDRSPLLTTNPPEIQATAMALLSLKKRKKEVKIQKSLKWLTGEKTDLQSASKISWAALALCSYGEDSKDLLNRLRQMQNKDGSFSQNVLTQAVACLAFEAAENPDVVAGA